MQFIVVLVGWGKVLSQTRARKTCNSSFKIIPTTGKSRFRFISLEQFIPISLPLLEIAWLL
jgi:hypothetical protein